MKEEGKWRKEGMETGRKEGNEGRTDGSEGREERGAGRKEQMLRKKGRKECGKEGRIC